MADERGRIFTDAAAYSDFHGWYARARELRDAEGPVYRVALPERDPFWAVLGQPEVMEVERQPDLFTNEPLSTLMPRRPSIDAPKQPAVVKTLINMDGEEHKKHRQLVNDWFKPGEVRKLSERVEEQARRSVDEMAALGGECDFAADVAMNYPLRVILEILGLPEGEFPRMLRLTQELFGAEDPDFERIGENEQMMAVIMDVIALFTDINAERRAHPTTDLATVIANGHIDGVALEDTDTYGYYLIVATAGHDTTSSAIAGGMRALLEHPDQLARLQAEPTRIDAACDEIVRWVSPVKHFMRSARDDYELAGTPIARGDWLLLSYAAANRDDRVFADPYTFDVARPDVDAHMGFGFGRHYCLGAHLARLEIRAFFRELLPRLESIEPAGDTPFVASTLVSGPKRMPVRYRFRN